MALKTTISQLQRLLSEVQNNLEKAGRGNRSASQRVRTGSIKLAQIAKVYRKESVLAERKKRRK